jgi:TolB-like protein
MTRDHRRLAAIVSADVVGYSLLMGRDDSATLAGLKAHRRELIDPKITEYGGRIVKTTGDGDPEQEYFADGMVEEIITALSRIRWLFVIARNSCFTYKGLAADVKRVGRELGVRYVLEGSVRRAGQRVRITAQLIEATTGEHLWADRFDGSLEDVFDLQNQVAVSVAGIIEPTLEAAEIRRSTARPTNDLTAYDLYLRALSHLRSWQKEEYFLALDLFGEALKRDSHYGPALAFAARCHQNLHVIGWTNDPESNRRAGVDLARRALGAAADDPVVLGNAAYVLAYFGEDIGAAIDLIDRALVLNPSLADGWRNGGFVRLWAGQSEPAINYFETCLRLSPAKTGRALSSGSAWPILWLGDSRMPKRCSSGRCKSVRPGRPPTALSRPATRIWGGSTKRERWFGGCRPSRPSWCRVPRFCATPNTASCFSQACAWQPARQVEPRRHT